MRQLIYAPAPAGNPLKGLVPYAGEGGDKFLHSMEFDYLPLGTLAMGPNRFDWMPLEKLLNDISGRGHQAIFRIFLEYPDRTDGIPAFLVRDGLKVHRWKDTGVEPDPPAPVETPDYEDPRLRRLLVNFIGEMGRKYDGDPRIGYITAGLLGTWGEWHTYPKEELFASKFVQTEVMDAYEKAFRRTPVLLRYPAGPGDGTYAPNDRRRFGYHDDSFAWATLETEKPDDDWFYLSLLKKAGPNALAKWKTQPIGGEIRPEAWGRVFDPATDLKEIQNFEKCVAQTHAAWLMDTGMFEKTPSAERRRRAEAQVRKMGYEFHVRAATLAPRRDSVLVRTEIVNRGVAPFYHDWQVEYSLRALNNASQIESRQIFPYKERLTGLLPGASPRVWEERLSFSGLPPGKCAVSLRVVNPMKGGKPLFFANADNDPKRPGWLPLGETTILKG